MMVNPLPVEKIEMFDEEDVGTTTTSKKLPVAYTSSTEASRRTKAPKLRPAISKEISS